MKAKGGPGFDQICHVESKTQCPHSDEALGYTILYQTKVIFSSTTYRPHRQAKILVERACVSRLIFFAEGRIVRRVSPQRQQTRRRAACNKQGGQRKAIEKTAQERNTNRNTAASASSVTKKGQREPTCWHCCSLLVYSNNNGDNKKYSYKQYFKQSKTHKKRE